MYPISNAVKALFEAEQYQTIRITGTDRNGATISITDANVIMNGFSVDRYSCNGDKLEVGTAIASELTLKLDNRDGQYNGIVFEGAELFVEIGISDWSGPNPTVTYIPCGYFTSYDQPRSLSTITIHALDRMAKFDLLPPSPMPWTNNNGNVMTDGNGETIYFMVGVVTPATIKGIVEQVCERCGITIGTDLTTLPNYNFTISEMPVLQQQVSYRNVIQWCAGIMGTNAWFDWNGNLRFTWYGESTNYVTTAANRFNSDLYENDITITGVSYTNTQNSTIVSGNADYTIDMTGNYLASDGIAQILPAVKNKVSGFTYRPFSASVINAPYLWPMDMITFVKDGVNHTCALTNVNFGINGNTSLQSKGETAQSNSGTAPSGATNEQAFLVEKALNAAVDIVDQSLSQEEIFNRLTNNGQVQGLLLYNGRVYLNADYIRSGTISAQYIDASQLHVSAANIDGTLIIGQLPSNVAVDSDLPTKVSELTNDSGYQNSTQVTTIAGNVITTAQLNADNIVTGTLNGNTVTIINLNASNIKTGVLSSVDGNTTWDLINGILQNSFHYTRYDEGSGELEADYHTRARMIGGQIVFYAMDDLAGATSYTKQGGIGATGSGVSLFDSRARGYVTIETGPDAGSFDSTSLNTDGRIVVTTDSSSQSTIWLHCTRLRVGTSDDLQTHYGANGTFTTADGKTVTVTNGIITGIA